METKDVEAAENNGVSSKRVQEMALFLLAEDLREPHNRGSKLDNKRVGELWLSRKHWVAVYTFIRFFGGDLSPTILGLHLALQHL